MKKKFIGFGVALFLLVAMVGFFLNAEPVDSYCCGGDPSIIKLTVNGWDTPELTIGVDEYVNWENGIIDSTHTATSTTGEFDTGDLKYGEYGYYKFTQTGIYNFYSKYDGSFVGKITVE